MLNLKGQTLLELVVGMSLITVVIGALAITTTYSLRNTQFSKNQAQATKLAQENLEKVRTIKSSNYGVCPDGQVPCLTWEEIWDEKFGKAGSCSALGCTYIPTNNCTVTDDLVKALCLTYSAAPVNIGNGFTAQVIIEDDVASSGTQKTVTSRVFWTDTTGEHSSDLVTVFSKL